MRHVHVGLQERPSDAAMAAPQARRGFALPMAILVIAFLTVTIAAAYTATSSEITTNAAQRGESRAYMIAQAGLESFIARRNEPDFCPTTPRPGQQTAPCGVPPVVLVETTTVTLPGGFARITAQQVRVGDGTNPAVYLIRSRGVDTASKAITGSSILTATMAANSRAERTVAQLVYWNVNQVNVLAGWTAANGLNKQGSSGTISGIDANKPNPAGQYPQGCPPITKPTVAGIAVPTGDASINQNFTPDGSPPIQYLGTQAETNASMKIDWDGIVNGDRIQPDYDFPNGSVAAAQWPNMSSPDNYPVIRVNGDFTMPGMGGHGTLIVMGNLTISGNNMWQGIIMVGGQMTSNGNGTMLGATMSGLNELLTTPELQLAQTKSSSTLLAHPPNATANGTKTFQYNSCEVSKAAAGLASYSVFPNAWMDNFVTY